MTKKDFQLIADVLKALGEKAAYCFDDNRDRYWIASSFASTLIRTSPRFDVGRFMIAALGEDVPCVCCGEVYNEDEAPGDWTNNFFCGNCSMCEKVLEGGDEPSH